ncbi:MAG: type III pantothenate kinase [Telluria sp.]
MLLLVDAGNTRVKWALVQAAAPLGQWTAQGAVAHADLASLGTAWQGHAIERAIVANVAGPDLRARLSALLPPVPVDWFASRAARAGLSNRYRDPSRLGCDRFAAAIGARALVPGKAVIVATCGTATTVDAVSADGAFIGGMILPGLALMASSLAQNTAQLPQVAPGASLPPLFADNTDDAIVSGCLSAQAGAIERAVGAHQAAECIVSGGAAPWIASALKIPHRLVDNMVLVGLHAAATCPNEMED